MGWVLIVNGTSFECWFFQRGEGVDIIQGRCEITPCATTVAAHKMLILLTFSEFLGGG